jgi:plasmid stabilization system protein ParE
MSALLESSPPPAKPTVRVRPPIVRTIVIVGLLGFVVSFGIGFTRARLELKQEEQRTVAEMRDTLSAAAATLESKGPAPSRAPAPSALPAGSSDVAKAGAVFRNMVNRTLAQRQAYERELEAAGWLRILDGTRIAKDSSLDESRAILQRAKAIVAKYRASTDELIAASRREIETIDVSARTRTSMLEGFERALPGSKQQAEQMWSLEEQIVGEVDQVIALLGAKKKAWRVEGGEIAFTRQAELDAFNAHMSRVQSIAARQEQMQRASIEKAQNGLKQLAK